MKSNIVLVGLNYEYVKSVALALCDILDMFYLDVKGLIKYNLVDEQTVISTAGVEYYENETNKLAISTASYENSIINFPYDLLLKDEIFNEIKHSAVFIFIDVNKQALQKIDKENQIEDKQTIQLLAFEEISSLIKDRCNFIAQGKNVKNCVNNIINFLKKM